MEGWINFWRVVCLIGFAAFYVLVLAVIPLGARDLLRLFRHLNAGGERPDEPSPPPTTEGEPK